MLCALNIQVLSHRWDAAGLGWTAKDAAAAAVTRRAREDRILLRGRTTNANGPAGRYFVPSAG